ncbi:hypothetical protein [Nostoc sp.]|uniref:hypothetical protein n=1 Tax=Nostoc sp. TaxID=1180 RepID=UPI002FFB7A80
MTRYRFSTRRCANAIALGVSLWEKTAVAPHERLHQAVRAASPLLPKGEASAKGEGIEEKI